MFLKISRNLQESTCARVCARPQRATLSEKETLEHVISSEFCEIFENTFLTEYLRMTASVLLNLNRNIIFAVLAQIIGKGLKA